MAFVLHRQPTVSAGRPLMAQPDLIAEPDGGDELVAQSTMDETRMKKMDLADGIKSDDGTVYNFWLSSLAEGELIKEYKITMLKEAKSKVGT